MVKINYLEPYQEHYALGGRLVQPHAEIIGNLYAYKSLGYVWFQRLINKEKVRFSQSCQTTPDDLIIYNWVKKIKL